MSTRRLRQTEPAENSGGKKKRTLGKHAVGHPFRIARSVSVRDAVTCLCRKVFDLMFLRGETSAHQLPKVPNLHLSRLISQDCLAQRLEQVPVLRPGRAMSSSQLLPSMGLLPMLPCCLAALFSRLLCCRNDIRADAVAANSLRPRYLLRVNFSRHLFGSVVHNLAILLAVSKDSFFCPPTALRVLGNAYSLRSSLDKPVKGLQDPSLSSSRVGARIAALRVCRRRCHLSPPSAKSTWTSSPPRDIQGVFLAPPWSAADPAVLAAQAADRFRVNMVFTVTPTYPLETRCNPYVWRGAVARGPLVPMLCRGCQWCAHTRTLQRSGCMKSNASSAA